MATSFQFATDADIAAVLKLRLAVDADQARRFGNDRGWTTITEKSVARVQVLASPGRAPERADYRSAADGDEEAVGD
jgi:hypothetical protein